MIFVTAAGSTLAFDELVKTVDELVGKKRIKEKVIIQIGNGEYFPKNCKWFRYDKNLGDYYKRANLIISHSGAGTLFELIGKGKKTIVVINPRAVNNPDIVIKLSKEKHILWCKEIKELERCLREVKKFKFKKYKKPKCEIHKVIEEFLENV